VVGAGAVGSVPPSKQGLLDSVECCVSGSAGDVKYHAD
jgi:hypothetical protein